MERSVALQSNVIIGLKVVLAFFNRMAWSEDATEKCKSKDFNIRKSIFEFSVKTLDAMCGTLTLMCSSSSKKLAAGIIIKVRQFVGA